MVNGKRPKPVQPCFSPLFSGMSLLASGLLWFTGGSLAIKFIFEAKSTKSVPFQVCSNVCLLVSNQNHSTLLHIFCLIFLF